MFTLQVRPHLPQTQFAVLEERKKASKVDTSSIHVVRSNTIAHIFLRYQNTLMQSNCDKLTFSLCSNKIRLGLFEY